MASLRKPGPSQATSSQQRAFRTALRITITIPWLLYEQLCQASAKQGRSLSNLAARWLNPFRQS